MPPPSQQAWNRLRSLFKKYLTFADLKDAAGNAGLEVDQLAHLQQRSLPEHGASKSELLDGIGRLFANRPEKDRIEILGIFTRECLRKYPEREGEFRSAFRRPGIILMEHGELFVYVPDEPGTVLDTTMRSSSELDAHVASSAPPPSIFVSYSHVDLAFKRQLEKHLKAFFFNGTLSFWSDDQIAPGTAWFEELAQALDSAKVAVLLVTGDFLASGFIRQHELEPVLRRHSSGGIDLIWVPVRACNWEETPLKNIQAAISPDKPLAEMKAQRDRAWVDVCRRIKKAASS